MELILLSNSSLLYNTIAEKSMKNYVSHPSHQVEQVGTVDRGVTFSLLNNFSDIYFSDLCFTKPGFQAIRRIYSLCKNWGKLKQQSLIRK